MQLLRHLRLRTKLTFLLGLSIMALVVSLGVAASLTRQRMLDDRVGKLRNVVQSTIAIVQFLDKRMASDVTSGIAGVSQAASETGAGSGLVLSAASDLAKRADQLSGEVRDFVVGVRRAA